VITRSVLFSLKCTRNRLAARLRPDPLGEFERSSRSHSCIRGWGPQERKERERMGREAMGREAMGREGMCPPKLPMAPLVPVLWHRRYVFLLKSSIRGISVT